MRQDLTVEAVEVAAPHLAHSARVASSVEEVAREALLAQPTDEEWVSSCIKYRNAGWEGVPDDYDRMFWESGYRAGRDAAARIARGETKEADHGE